MLTKDDDSTPKLTSVKLVEDLRQRVTSGELSPGTRLRQREIADYYDVSSMSARDAVKILLEEGFASQEGAKTIVVSKLSPIDFLEIMELRQVLEPRMLELSGPRLSAEAIAEMKAIVGSDGEVWTPEETAERHWAFHRILYSRAARPRTFDILERLNSHITRYMLPLWYSIGIGSDWRSHHLSLVRSVEEGAVLDAVEELRTDLALTKARVLENMTLD